MTIRVVPDYETWVGLLGSRFFPIGNGDSSVLFCVDDDELEEISEGRAELMPLYDAVRLQFPAIQSDGRWAGMRTDVATRDFPRILPVLAATVLAVSRQRTNAFYRPFRELVGPPPLDDDDGRPPGFELLIREWERVAEWAERHGRGKLDLGRQHGTWDTYFYPARRQAIFKIRNTRRDLPRFFLERQLLVAGEKSALTLDDWERETDAFLVWCGRQADTKLQSYARLESSDLRAEIKERLEAAYEEWDGTVEDEQGFPSYPRLHLIWDIDRLLLSGGRVFVGIPSAAVAERLGLDPSELDVRHVATGAALRGEEAGAFVTFADMVDGRSLTADDVFLDGDGALFEVTDALGKTARLTLSPPMTAPESGVEFRHLVEDAETYFYVERRSRTIGAFSKIAVREQDVRRLGGEVGTSGEGGDGLRILDGPVGLLNDLGVAVDASSDLRLVGGLRTGIHEWVEGAGPDLVLPDGSSGLKIARPGFPTVQVPCSGSLVQWDDLEVSPGGAFSVQAFDQFNRELGPMRELSFASAEVILRRLATLTPAVTPLESSRRSQWQPIPAASDWVVTIGAEPGLIARHGVSSAVTRLPSPIQEWLQQDALLLTVSEWRFSPVAIVTSIDSRVRAEWVGDWTRSDSSLDLGMSSPGLMESVIWAAWVVGLPLPSNPEHERTLRSAAQVIHANAEEFSSAWIGRAEELLNEIDE